MARLAMAGRQGGGTKEAKGRGSSKEGVCREGGERKGNRAPKKMKKSLSIDLKKAISILCTFFL